MSTLGVFCTVIFILLLIILVLCFLVHKYRSEKQELLGAYETSMKSLSLVQLDKMEIPHIFQGRGNHNVVQVIWTKVMAEKRQKAMEEKAKAKGKMIEA
ncbi:MAG: hypothetical protein WC878_05385 [Candidatus Paceibacterota bacterium]|jgi:hypothetical protein